MALNIGGSANLKNYVKYNAKADKWFVRGADGEDKEIARPTFVIDFDNIATGWLRFREGEAPERVMDPSLDKAAPLPGDGFKRGFVVMAYSPKFFGGAVEFASASIHLANAIKDVHAQYEAEKAAHPGQLPVIASSGSQAMKDRFGVNYRPTFSLVQWVDRPADLPSASPVAAAEVWQGNSVSAPAPKTLAQHVPPPAPKPAADPMNEALF
jgi:hypothetical protein